MVAMTSVAPGSRNVLTRRIETRSGSVAAANSRARRTIRAPTAMVATAMSTTIGPVQPRTTKATAAIANATTSFVVGLRAR
jgi:hypothetical protein